MAVPQMPRKWKCRVVLLKNQSVFACGAWVLPQRACWCKPCFLPVLPYGLNRPDDPAQPAKLLNDPGKQTFESLPVGATIEFTIAGVSDTGEGPTSVPVSVVVV